MEKLELKHLASYLPYELIVKSIRDKMYILDIYSNMRGSGMEKREISSVLSEEMKPLLRPLSDLSNSVYYEKFSMNRKLIDDHIIIKRLSTIDFEEKNNLITYYHLSFLENYEIIECLFELHFDIFGLIEKGLAIDINTIKKG